MDTRSQKRRKIEEEEGITTEKQLDDAINSYAKANNCSLAAALMFLMIRKRVSLSLVQALEDRTTGSFSAAEYDQIAHHFWKKDDTLSHLARGHDILVLPLQFCRIPMALFKEIVADVDRAKLQYGEFQQHANEEARQRFVATWFERLVTAFHGGVQNKPESVMSGRISTGGRVEFQYHVAGSCVMMLVELNYILTGRTLVKALAQVLCELDGADYKNFTKGLHVPTVRALLSDGRSFHFFGFTSADRRVYRYGSVLGIDVHPGNPKEYLLAMKSVLQAVFWMLMDGWLQGLSAFTALSQGRVCYSQGLEVSQGRRSYKQWAAATLQAARALHKGLEAAQQKSDKVAEESLALLYDSFKELPKDEVGLSDNPDDTYVHLCESLADELRDI